MANKVGLDQGTIYAIQNCGGWHLSCGASQELYSRLPFGRVKPPPEEWRQFGVLRSGFVFDVPPSFLLTQRAENGQGATFEERGGASLVVWGEDLATGDFRAKIGRQMAADERKRVASDLPQADSEMGKLLRHQRRQNSLFSGGCYLCGSSGCI